MEVLVPECIDLKRRNRDRTGHSIKLPLFNRSASVKTKTIREGSFFIQSVKLFNALPRNIRDTREYSVDQLKRKQDKFLLELPDAPLIPCYTAS